MENEEQYQKYVQIAQAMEEKGEYSDANMQYRKALNLAPPTDMQQLIEAIRKTREAAKASPKHTISKLPAGFKQYSKRFSDAIGYKAHKKLLKRWIGLPMEEKGRYTANKIAKSIGILIFGPPGTGKTLIVQCLSGEFNVPMKIIFVSDILGKLVGESERNMKQVFIDARATQPCIIFFDELDALGSSRESSNEFTSNDIRNTINEFLAQLSLLYDDIEQTVFVLGATNLPWKLDSALIRSGRFGHHIFIGPPNFWDRRKILKYYLDTEGKDYDLKHINWSLLAIATARYSQADIRKVCEATVNRTIANKRSAITTHDIQKVLKSREEGTTTLENWILKAKTVYLKKSKKVVHRTGFMGWRKQKEKVEEQGNLDEADLATFLPIINYIKRTQRWWVPTSIIRFIAKGI